MWHSIILGLIVCVHVLKKIDDERIEPSMKRKIKILKYKTFGILLWPLVYYSVLPKEESETKKFLLPFLWPFMLWLWDSYLLTYGLVAETSKSNVASARIEPSSISSMSFALLGMLGGSTTGKHSYIFLYTVLLCIAFVFPNHNLAPGSPEDLVVEALQKTVLLWSLGLMFSGVVLQNTAFLQKMSEECKKIT